MFVFDGIIVTAVLVDRSSGTRLTRHPGRGEVWFVPSVCLGATCRCPLRAGWAPTGLETL